MPKTTVKIERNYWPHAIVTMILLAIIACGWTIKIALDNPVEMDSYYLAKYQKVETNINEILGQQELFDTKYNIKHHSVKFVQGEDNKIEFAITDKDGNAINDAKVRLVISRPETNANNQEFLLQSGQNGIYAFDGIKADKPGRWQVLTRISIDGVEGYNKHEVFAAK
jgi:hypothetical protein